MMHRVLSAALRQAVKWQLLSANPCDAVTAPRVERRQARVLDADGAAALIEAARPRAMFMPVLLGVTCGLRRGELAALTWHHVDLDAARLQIVVSAEQTSQGVRIKPPKSGRSRVVAMPALVVEELRRYRLKQAEELLKIGVRQSNETYVCLQPNYEPWAPWNLSSTFAKLIKTTGLPRPSARSAALTCDAFAGRKRTPQNRAGTAWPRQHRDHYEPVQSRHAGDAR